MKLSECLWTYVETGVHLSTSTIKKTRQKLCWKKCGLHYCQMLRETNRIVRLAFTQECLEKGEDFEDVVFTNESTIWLEQHGKICFRKEGTPGKPRSKHLFKVNVWAGISKRCPTDFDLHWYNEEGVLRQQDSVQSIPPIYSGYF